MRLLAALLLGLVFCGTAAAQTVPVPSPTPTPVATPPPVPAAQPGVLVAGVPVSGQTRAQIRATLRDEVRPLVRVPVVLRHGKRTATLRPGRAKQVFDVDRTIRRVLAADPATEVAPAVAFDRARVRAFVDGFARKVLVPALDARVVIRVRRIRATRARAGRRLASRNVAWRVRRVLAEPARSRTLRVTPVRAEPRVRVRDLPRLYPTIVTVDKSSFTLRLFKRLRYDRRYGVAVGQPAYPTPTGLFAIQSKQVNPTWTAPDSPWAGEAAGQSFSPGDPNNPLAARWMGVSGSVGIHGTYQEQSIGTAASHGCIRMRSADVKHLYRRVSVGTPVLIAA